MPFICLMIKFQHLCKHTERQTQSHDKQTCILVDSSFFFNEYRELECLKASSKYRPKANSECCTECCTLLPVSKSNQLQNKRVMHSLPFPFKSKLCIIFFLKMLKHLIACFWLEQRRRIYVTQNVKTAAGLCLLLPTPLLVCFGVKEKGPCCSLHYKSFTGFA